jgi:hypothetical protein
METSSERRSRRAALEGSKATDRLDGPLTVRWEE